MLSWRITWAVIGRLEMRLIAALTLASFVLSACANQGLRTLRSTSSGPDEFIVQPSAELQTPPDLSVLPPPTPGGTNRTDNDPAGEAVIALGGRPGDVNAPIPSSDRALVAASGRYGVSPDIRQTLAAEDAEFRRKQARFTQYRIVQTDLYSQVYRSQSLDARATAQSWQRAGVPTPSFPPASE